MVVGKIKSLWDPNSEAKSRPGAVGLNFYKEKSICLEDIRWSRSGSIMFWDCDIVEPKWSTIIK